MVVRGKGMHHAVPVFYAVPALVQLRHFDKYLTESVLEHVTVDQFSFFTVYA